MWPLLLCLVALSASAETPVEQRISGRRFPSVFQAWSPADNLPGEDRWTTAARHDLIFSGPEFFGLRWDRSPAGLATRFTADSVEAALRTRAMLLAKNPNLVLLAEIRYRDASRRFLPPDHPWWKRDASGKAKAGWEEGGYLLLDYESEGFRDQVAAQAAAAVATGVVDGVMLDWWKDDDARLALVRRIREMIGERALILVNANDRTTPVTAPYVNGYFMECYRSRTPAEWERIGATLAWAGQHLRTPRILCLETWYEKSRADLNRMRATTTLALTRSDGYALFSDPNPLPTPDHLHDWYPFWEKSLGRPVDTGRAHPDGTWRRSFERGIAVYNPPAGAPAVIRLDAPHRSLATGKTAAEHTVPAWDGDIFLK
jgi:hypothetical protein